MIQVEKHGNTYPFWRCVCPNCGCQFTFDHRDTYLSHFYDEDSLQEVIDCPECVYTVEASYWET